MSKTSSEAGIPDNFSDGFIDALEMSLTLTISGETFEIPGANIKFVKADIHPYGFTASLGFWVSSVKVKDNLFEKFIKQDIIGVKLGIESHDFKLKKNENTESLEIQGFVTDKALLNEFTSENINLTGDPVLCRYYRIDFSDPASVLWNQHFPFDIKVDQSIKELIEANNVTGVNLQYDWTILNSKHAINTLSPGSPDNESSFYDFIVWFTSVNNGVFTYNIKKNQYTLSGEKEKGGNAVSMSELEVADHRVEFPSAFRSNVRFLNMVSDNNSNDSKKLVTDRNEAVKGSRKDFVLREPVASAFKDAFNLESKKEINREQELHIIHTRFPLITYRPGTLVKLEGGLWSKKIFLKGKVYRVSDIFLRFNAIDDGPDADHNMSWSKYHISIHSKLELKDEKAQNLPVYKVPAFPVYVEGKIVSEQGKEDEETYQIYKDSQTQLGYYKVKIPVFDKIITAPFDPLFTSGHFYFPAYKNERVLIALHFHSARITAFLDWRPDCQLPMDTQGNHILMGKNSKSRTSISHVYVDNNPQLNMKRTSNKDTELIQLKEGTIILQTKEEK